MHVLGGVAGGAVLSTAAWLALTPIRTLTPLPFNRLLVLAMCSWTALGDLGLLRVPRQERQVPQSWLVRYGPARSYFLYGLELGAGLVTYIPFATTYALFTASALVLGLADAIFVGILFGLGRTLLVGPINLDQRLVRWLGDHYGIAYGPLSRLSVAAALLVVAAAVTIPAALSL